jgi:MazG-like family
VRQKGVSHVTDKLYLKALVLHVGWFCPYFRAYWRLKQPLLNSSAFPTSLTWLIRLPTRLSRHLSPSEIGRNSTRPRTSPRVLQSRPASYSSAFQWGSEADPKRMREELADVLTYCLLLADRIGADLEKIVLEKLEVTRKSTRWTWPKEPVESTMNSIIAPLEFSRTVVATWKHLDDKHVNWPVVYVLDDGSDPRHRHSNGLRDSYVGESLNAARRLRQHLDTPAKQHL